MSKKIFLKKLAFPAVLLLLFCFSSLNNFVFASTTNGTIDTTYKYAWGENLGWISFGCDNCGVTVNDATITGLAWSKQYGWIKLNPDNSGVKNNAEGVLSGFAWGKNIGWIDFTGVTIDTSGLFSGYATVKHDNSRINFSCMTGDSCATADFRVKTDWRPASTRTSGNNNLGGGGGGHPIPPLPAPIINPIITVSDNIAKIVDKVSGSILDLFKPKKISETNLVVVPKVAPNSFKTRWNLLPVQAISSFVFAPLPYEVRALANKFPELNKTFKEVGVERLTDLSKLNGVTLNLPGLTALTNTLANVGTQRLSEVNKLNGVTLGVPGFSNLNQKMLNSVGTGKIALVGGLPIAKFSLVAKQNLPTEFVFARTASELVDLKVAMSIGDTGQVTQNIETLPGKTMRLVVKPISKARNVTGYFVFKSATPRVSQNKIFRESLTASALFATNDLVQSTPLPLPIEKKLVLSTFEYTDPDHDGIYTADVVSPVVPGEYEIITVIDYIDPVLGSRKMSMIAVIDPEGYIYEKNNGKETRIPSAIVSLYYLNISTKKYELWNAKDYSQDNPQITDVRGTYSFLVPEGSYYFEVEAPGYNHYQSKVFVVGGGSGIHQNIELNSGGSFLADLDWKTILLIVVFLLLVYNLYRNTLRDKLLKFSNKQDGK